MLRLSWFLVRIEKLTKKRLHETSYVYADAFDQDIIMRRIVAPGSSNRQQKIARYFRWSMLYTGLENIDIAIDTATGKVLGVAMWEPPWHRPHKKASFLPKMSLFLTLGKGWWRELLAYEKAGEGAHPETPHWHLVDIGTAHAAQGKGVGSALIKHRLKEVDARGDVASLEGTSPGSKKLYARLGFQPVKDLDEPAKGATVMVRESVKEDRVSDVLIIGGGLAGLAAAEKLVTEAPHKKVTLLEAADRFGGRTHGEYWEPADRVIDLGGTWLLPGFSESFAILERFGIETVESPASDLWLTHLSDGVQVRRELSEAELEALKMALEELTTFVSEQATPPSAAEALRSLDGWEHEHKQIVVDWQLAMQRYLAGASPDTFGAEHLLLALEDIADPEHYHTQIAGTTLALVNALVKRIENTVQLNNTAQLKLNEEVVSIYRAEASRFVVKTSSGSEYYAQRLIIALPINVLRKIDIEEGLLGAYEGLLRSPHVGESRKDWFVLQNVADHFRVFASEGPYGYFRSEAKLGDTPDGKNRMLCVGLVPAHEGSPSVDELAAAITQYLPDAKVEAYQTYDWIGEKFSLGTWYVPRPGGYAEIAAAEAGREELERQCISVVGGDVDPTFPGTIEGAIASGRRAAEEA